MMFLSLGLFKRIVFSPLKTSVLMKPANLMQEKLHNCFSPFVMVLKHPDECVSTVLRDKKMEPGKNIREICGEIQSSRFLRKGKEGK